MKLKKCLYNFFIFARNFFGDQKKSIKLIAEIPFDSEFALLFLLLRFSLKNKSM